jgi:RNA recognition motif-containing protein
MRLCLYQGLCKNTATPQLFEAYGDVEQVRIITDSETGRSRGFGFVEMPEATAAQAAMAGLNRRGLGERTLSVTEARERGAPRPHDERRPRW